MFRVGGSCVLVLPASGCVTVASGVHGPAFTYPLFSRANTKPPSPITTSPAFRRSRIPCRSKRESHGHTSPVLYTEWIVKLLIFESSPIQHQQGNETSDSLWAITDWWCHTDIHTYATHAHTQWGFYDSLCVYVIEAAIQVQRWKDKSGFSLSVSGSDRFRLDISQITCTQTHTRT